MPAYIVFSTSLPQPETSHHYLFPELVLITVSTLPGVLLLCCSPSILYPLNSKPLLRNNIMPIHCLKLCSSFFSLLRIILKLLMIAAENLLTTSYSSLHPDLRPFPPSLIVSQSQRSSNSSWNSASSFCSFVTLSFPLPRMWFPGLYPKQLPFHHLNLSNYLRKIDSANSSHLSTVFLNTTPRAIFFLSEYNYL